MKHYLDALPADASLSARFGTLLHRVLESLLREHVRNNRVGRIAVDDAMRAFGREWAQGDLTDPALYEEGLGLVKAWALRQGEIDRNVVGIEQELTVARDARSAATGSESVRIDAESVAVDAESIGRNPRSTAIDVESDGDRLEISAQRLRLPGDAFLGVVTEVFGKRGRTEWPSGE